MPASDGQAGRECTMSYSKAGKEVFVPVGHLKKYILLPIIEEKQFNYGD